MTAHEHLSDPAIRELRQYWQELGLDLPAIVRRKATRPEVAPPSAHGDSLDSICTALGTGCGSALCANKTKLVFGAGDPKANIMFVGEAPGVDEDAQGLPFVGPAGELLTKIIEAMGFRREEVYITNVVKCRPPEHQAPAPEEISICSPFLRSQIRVVHPQVIVALGGTAATTLLATKGSMNTLRGRFHPLVWDPEVPVMPTYHPAYLLRNPAAKKTVWEDMKQVMARVAPKS